MSMYEGGLALTNLAGVDALREIIVAGQPIKIKTRSGGGDDFCKDSIQTGMSMAIDMVFEQNPLCQRAGVELICNLCASDTVISKISEKCDAIKESGGGLTNPDVEAIPLEIKLLLL